MKVCHLARKKSVLRGKLCNEINKKQLCTHSFESSFI